FRQLGRPFELAYGHPDEEATRRQLTQAIRLTYTARALRDSTIGLVGAHAPGFINMQVDAGALNRDLGAQLHHFGLHEFIELAREQDEVAVGEDVDEVKGLGLPAEDGIGDDDLAVNSRYYLAMRALMDDEHLDALAVRCWPELPNVIGHWPYLAMARLAEEGRVVALEGDVDGALTCLLAKHLGLGMGYISDWLGHDAETITLWHPGNALGRFC
ncbi:MAG: sugar isomerase, partial [bacterium]|nr:sugar isomerase [bacterium]